MSTAFALSVIDELARDASQRGVVKYYTQLASMPSKSDMSFQEWALTSTGLICQSRSTVLDGLALPPAYRIPGSAGDAAGKLIPSPSYCESTFSLFLSRSTGTAKMTRRPYRADTVSHLVEVPPGQVPMVSVRRIRN